MAGINDSNGLWFAKTLTDRRISNLLPLSFAKSLADCEINDMAAAVSPALCYNS